MTIGVTVDQMIIRFKNMRIKKSIEDIVNSLKSY